MYITCTAHARIMDPFTSRYAVLLNRGAKRPLLTPVGGGLQCNSTQMRSLISDFDAYDYAKLPDLHFRVPDNRVKDVRKWFIKRTSRETSVLREFYEEICDEEKILSRAGARGVHENFVGFWIVPSSPRPEPGQEDTLRLVEVYDVTMPAAAMANMRLAAADPDLPLWLVTQKDIRHNFGKIDTRPEICRRTLSLVDFERQPKV